MRLSMKFLMLTVLAGLLYGCQTAKVFSPAPEVAFIKSQTDNVQDDVSQSGENQEEKKPSAYDEAMIIVSGVDSSSKCTTP